MFKPEDSYSAPAAEAPRPKPVPMKHDTLEFKAIADANTILRCQVGSGLHGIAIEGTDDRDEMGICVEPPEYVVGLRRFEQYEYRTQPNHVRSGPGDLDLVVYSLRKWAKLAAAGNPTVLLLLFAPEEQIVKVQWPGHDLRARRDLFISRDAADRYIGYLDGQRDRMLGLRAGRTNRPELIAKHGFDTKFAAHAVRLGMQGAELLSTGHITLPVPEADRQYLLSIRQGLVDKETVLRSIDAYRDKLACLRVTSNLAPTADYDAINNWLVTVYREWWARKGE